ncbi:glycosyltransferase [Streptomyces anulatus]|uniref:glycosyltransferase family 2 protein n=1 Tax=Streptomyces anulatus TaxID=1892 RepID=UPI00340A1770
MRSGEAATAEGVSVITPSWNNPANVGRFLTAMGTACKTVDAPTEIIVVDDSVPARAVEIRELCDAHDAHYVRGPRAVGAKRNRGARQARYSVLLFVDSDCIATERLVAEHLRSHREAEGGIGAVAGPVTVRDGGTDLASQVARRAMHANPPFEWGATHQVLEWAPTANVSVSAEAFHAVGGFDEHPFTVNGGEDVDLGVRLTAAGRPVVGNARARVNHGTEPESIRSLFKKVHRYGRADVFLRTRHAERSEPHGNRTTVAVTAGLAGLAVGRATGCRAIALAAPAVAVALLGSQRLRARPDGTADGLPARLVARAVDASFDVGTFSEALRRGSPRLILGRFPYYTDEHFRKTPQEDPRRQEGPA